ncbi:MAG TPA: histidine kinase N-terminal domain-containing protein [bacterium]|nr:histidine kinase N-terminal domain-containing protein [bacterium]
MISDRLIWRVEQQADYLEKRWARMLREHPATEHYHNFNDEYLQRSIREVYRHLSEYIEDAHSAEQLAGLFMDIGRQRKTQGVPLHELAFAIILARKNIWNFIMEEETFSSALKFHQMNEFWQRVMNFFDKNIYFVVHGFTKEPEEAEDSTDVISKYIHAFSLGSLPEVNKRALSEQ